MPWDINNLRSFAGTLAPLRRKIEEVGGAGQCAHQGKRSYRA